MCNLYSITTNQAAIASLFRQMNRYVGNLPPMPGVFPDYPAPVVRKAGDEQEMVLMRWGMPPPPKIGGPPVTNIRNTSSPHWRMWLKPENRCLVPANSFAEYAPEPNPQTKKKDVVWFALDDNRPLFAFAGIWTEFKGRSWNQVQAHPGPPPSLRIPDDLSECGRPAYPSEGSARHPHDRRGARRLDARALRRGERAAASAA
jgi:putative SOS response-associated peptidase YedK